jgi:hypothetical protein
MGKPPISQIPPTIREKEIKLKEMEVQLIKDYMGEKHQNTHITKEERVLLAVLYHDLAKNPWSISKQVCNDLGIPFDDKEFEIDFLKDFIADYLDFGLPMEREGRKEVERIFKAYFMQDENEEGKKEEKMIS